MDDIWLIFWIGVFLFTDVYLWLKLKKIIESKKRGIIKIALIGGNILLGFIAALIAITIWY